MTRSLAVPIVAVAIVGLTVLLFVGTERAESWFALGAVCLPALLLLLAEPGRGRPRLLVIAAVSAVVFLGGGFVALTVLSGTRSTDPSAAALLVQVLVMTLAPLVFLGVLYALDFARFTPADEDLERLRALDADLD